MATGTTTIVGGSSVRFALNEKEISAAQQALAQLEQGFTSGQVLTDPTAAASPTAFDVYNFKPGAGTFALPANAEAVVLTGENAGSIRGHTGSELLVGNQGDDSINAAGGNGSIIVGDGNNTVQLNDAGQAGGSVQITTGQGDNTINLWGGAVTVSAVSNPGEDGGDGRGQGHAYGHGDDHDDDGQGQGGGHDHDDHHAPNDTVNVYGGSNTITSSDALSVNVQDGSNVLNLSGDDHITLAGGANTVNLSAANSASDAHIANLGGSNTFNLTGGGEYAFTGVGSAVTQSGGGAFDLHMSGNDTITLGSGSDTIVEAGAATVYAGAGSLLFNGGAGHSYVEAGSGASTLIGGSGDDTFVGGAGTSFMKGGGGANVFMGGSGADTMNGAGAASNLFSFDQTKVAGATDVVQGFSSGRDHIQLVGYDTAAALAGAKVVGGNTVISLDGGATKIELIGVTHLNASGVSH